MQGREEVILLGSYPRDRGFESFPCNHSRHCAPWGITMQSQQFLSAANLGISALERGALVHVLGMLERKEVVHVPLSEEVLARGIVTGNPPAVGRPNGFSMGPYIYHDGNCGTAACMAGWAHISSGKAVFGDRRIQDICMRGNGPAALADLFTARHKDRTVEEAAVALRSYLTTGDARWDEPAPVAAKVLPECLRADALASRSLIPA